MEVEQLLQQALALGEEGRWDEMAEHLRGGLEEHGDDPFVLCWLGVAEAELGLAGVAYERFKRCLALDPEDATVLAMAGSALAELDDPGAESALRTATLLAPELALARRAYGSYLAREGLFGDAFRELDAARELAPDDEVVAAERGGALALGRRMEEAAEEFQRAVELAPDDGWNRVLLALTLVELEELEAAGEELVAAARLRPDDVDGLVLAAVAAAALGWDDLAYEFLEQARLRASAEELSFVEEAEERVERGGSVADAYLRDTLTPVSLHTRLMARP